MPDTLVGLLLLVAAAAPGAIYVRTVERYLPQRETSEVRQVAELVLVGTATTIVALTVWLALLALADAAIPRAFSGEHLLAFAENPVAFLITSWRSALFVLVSLALVLAGSSALAIGTARVTTRGQPARIHPHHGTWYEAIGVWQNTHHVFATLELKEGETYSGYVRSVPLDDDENRALILKGDLFCRPSRGENEEKIAQDYLVIPLAEIRLAGLELTRKPG